MIEATVLIGLTVFCACAVLLNAGERRHRREAHMDVGDRQRIRAASQEALAKHQLFSVPAADRRVEKTWRKAS